MPEAICDLPYEGAKEMLLVDEVDSKAFLTKLFEAMYDELPLPKHCSGMVSFWHRISSQIKKFWCWQVYKIDFTLLFCVAFPLQHDVIKWNGENSNEKNCTYYYFIDGVSSHSLQFTVQETSIALEHSEQPLPASTEVTTVADSVSSFRETTYLEILTTYARALSEKWDGSSLMESNIDTLLMDCYGDAPLENVGYAVIDLDGDGIEELVIGTTERFTDEFYGKLILALYTRDGEDTKHTVFQSIARDRYYYAGENKFANLGSSGADDSVDITVQYAGGTLTDIGIVTDPADYVQMELTPMREWIQTIGLPGCPDVW